MSCVVGLRERKKAATRTALSSAAMRLAIEQGLEHVTVDAIAAEADVSPRTFHNYFSSREEAIAAPMVDFGDRLTEELAARPVGESIWAALHEVIVGSLDESEATRKSLTAQVELFSTHPSVLASEMAAMEEMRVRFADVVASRTGTDARYEMYPHLVAGAAANALKTAFDLWAVRPGSGVVALVDEAFAMIGSGLPEPIGETEPSGGAEASDGTEPINTRSADELRDHR